MNPHNLARSVKCLGTAPLSPRPMPLFAVPSILLHWSLNGVIRAVIGAFLFVGTGYAQSNGDTLLWDSTSASSWINATAWWDVQTGAFNSLNTTANRNKTYNFLFQGTGTNSTVAPTAMTLTSNNFYATSIIFQNNFNTTNTTSFSDGGSTNSILTLGAGSGSAGGAATPWNIADNASSGSVNFIPTTSTGNLSLSLYAGGTISVASGASMAFSTAINDFDATHTGGITKTGTGTVTLSGTNTYSGGTTVQGGTLLINNTSGSGYWQRCGDRQQ